MSKDFVVGAAVRLPLSIIDAASNVLADPGTLALKIRKPDKTLSTLVYGIDTRVARVSMGAYHADINLDQAGIWKYRWEAQAPASGAVEGFFKVQASYVL